jgi:hypothetical protein
LAVTDNLPLDTRWRTVEEALAAMAKRDETTSVLLIKDGPATRGRTRWCASRPRPPMTWRA